MARNNLPCSTVIDSMNELIPTSAAAVTRALRANGYPKITGHDKYLGEGKTRPVYYLSGDIVAEGVEARMNELGFVTQRKFGMITVLGRNA